MIKKVSGILTLPLLSQILVKPVYAADPAPWSGRCVATVNVGGNTYNDVATIQGFECLFANILQVIVFIAGIVFFFMLISGGFQYIFSSGDQKKTAKASSTLTLAVIGLVGIIISWFILRLIQNFTGVNVTDFIIPG